MSTRRLYFGTCQTCPHDTGRCNAVLVDPDNLPPERVERAAKARYECQHYFGWDSLPPSQQLLQIEDQEAAIRAFLSDPEPGDQ